MNKATLDFQKLKLNKYLYRWIFSLWLIISIFLWFNYTKYISSIYPLADIAKWGTFVETTTEPISYLPYTSQNDSWKFYQNLLFEPCVQTIFSGANIEFESKACEVTTTDNQTYRLSLNWEYMRSDWTNLSLKDIFFTYTSILKNNYWEIPSHSAFQNITISIENTNLIVTFPEISVDNIIFFTNFILPEHILANQDFEYYKQVYGSNPVVSTCAQIQSGKNNTQSLIYDLSNCEKYPLKFYQVTKIWDDDNSENEVFEENSIDLAYSQITNKLLPNTYIQNQFETVFFNANKIQNLDLRKHLASYINTAASEWSLDDKWGFVQDHFLYNEIIDKENFSQADFIDLLTRQTTSIEESPTVQALEKTEAIPWTISAEEISLDKESPTQYRLKTLDEGIERFKVEINFDTAYTRVSVKHNDGVPYFLQSYSPETESAIYNLNPTFRNIVSGKNTYIVSGYDETEEISKQRYVEVEYSDIQPTITTQLVQEIEEEVEEENKPLTFLYFKDDSHESIIEDIKNKLQNDGLEGYVNFEWVDDNDVLEGRLTAGEYDLILRTINMWLRRDLSSLFLSDDLTINPSGFVNEDLARLSKEYFLVDESKKEEVMQQINGIYGETAPLIILGKKKWTYYLDETIENPFPQRLYVRGWRKQYLENLSVFEHISVNRSEVFKLSNVWKYFLEA